MRTGEGEGVGDEARDGKSEGPTYRVFINCSSFEF